MLKAKWCSKTPPYSPLNLREKLGLKDADGLEWLRDLSPEEEAFLREVDQDVTDDLTQVHSADHLLKPEWRAKEGAEQEDRWPWVQQSFPTYDGRDLGRMPVFAWSIPLSSQPQATPQRGPPQTGALPAPDSPIPHPSTEHAQGSPSCQHHSDSWS